MPSVRGERPLERWLDPDLGVLGLLLATLFLLPFERPAPLVALGGLVITNLEALLLLTLAAWLARALSRPHSVRAPFFIWPAAAIVGAAHATEPAAETDVQP